MSFKLVYYVHGITTDNENDVAIGWNQGNLSVVGIQKLHEASRMTKALEYDAVFCSDLKRARHSAEILFEINSTPIIYDERLRECNYGTKNGIANLISYPGFHKEF